MPPAKSESFYFSALIDCLRVVMVFYGKSIISSILMEQRLTDLVDHVPDVGAAFDIDYIPIPFKTFRHPYKPCCRDGTFDEVKYAQGIRMIVKDILPNSMLALSHPPPLSLRDFPTRENFQFFTRAAIEKPYLFETTHVFRMRDVQYTKSGQREHWLREKSWSPSFEDDQMSDRPLLPLKAAIPEYLPLYLTVRGDDPMAPPKDLLQKAQADSP